MDSIIEQKKRPGFFSPHFLSFLQSLFVFTSSTPNHWMTKFFAEVYWRDQVIEVQIKLHLRKEDGKSERQVLMSTGLNRTYLHSFPTDIVKFVNIPHWTRLKKSKINFQLQRVPCLKAMQKFKLTIQGNSH